MPNLRLTFATSDVLHLHDLVNGTIRPKGIDLTFLFMGIEENNDRFTHFHEWEVSELSFGNYCASLCQDPPPAIALPVFTSRAFRHSAIYIHERSKIKSPADLKGRRIGIPQWSQTATIYMRGYLSHDCGVPLDSVEWIQAGINEPGRRETAKIELPSGVRLTSRPDRALGEMLAQGDLDAVICARPPDLFRDKTHGLRRLFPDFRNEEERYWTSTKIFPIMHLVGIRRDAYEANRWIARSLYEALEDAKRAAVDRLVDRGFAFIPSAWALQEIDREFTFMYGKGEPWPYGVEPNRETLEAFVMYCHEQGITKRRLAVDELFPKELGLKIRV
jgi:4,5-dihydroxyphthalate decarboxylase